MTHASTSTAAPIATDGFVLHDEDRAAIAHEREHYPHPQAASIEALKIVQKRHGWVPDAAIEAIARELGVPPANIEGVATFYSLIFRQPVGRHVILLCDSSSCFLNDYEELLEALSARLGIGLGQTTEDGRFTLLPAQRLLIGPLLCPLLLELLLSLFADSLLRSLRHASTRWLVGSERNQSRHLGRRKS